MLVTQVPDHEEQVHRFVVFLGILPVRERLEMLEE